MVVILITVSGYHETGWQVDYRTSHATPVSHVGEIITGIDINNFWLYLEPQV